MNNLAYDFIGNLRAKCDSMLAKCRNPESFLEKLRIYLSEKKNTIVETESRRSRVCGLM
jgi:hypothetical protein